MTQSTEYLDIEETFAVHKPLEADNERLATIAEAAKTFAQIVLQVGEKSVERDHAMKAIREAEMWSRESILQSHRVTPEPPKGDLFPNWRSGKGHEIRLDD
ncbi:MAG: hypothetical protein B7Z73_03050 [Planctomycetia bacterium 21-64-5]|nr:MAG: hypothetical protein B7Z73_03050 [Planctomycetia bacterium 21-64-5]HQU42650.1 hypothetical protein [Pirellulales bacterium]